MRSDIVRRLLCTLTAASFFCGAGSAAAPDPPATGRDTDSLRVLRVHYESVDDVRDLAAFDLLEYADDVERYVLVLGDLEDQAKLHDMGFRVTLDVALTKRLHEPRALDPTQVSGIPGFPCYRTLEETIATAGAIVALHPQLATLLDVGDTWEKQNAIADRDLWVLRLTNAAVPGPKPKMFVTSAIHAREYAPAELMTRFAELMIDGYGVDPDATWILDHHEIHLMLHANPDGRKKAETGILWRKNTNQDYCSPTSSNRGADLNRNFEFQWACCGGASNWECDELYRGPNPASEPETNVVQDYLRAEFPDQRAEPLDAPAPDDATGIYMDIHAHGNLVLWPWGFNGQSPNVSTLRTLGRKLAFFNGYTAKQGVDLYPTDGNTMDFGYGDLGVASFAYEVGTWFFEECPFFENVVLPDNLPSFVYAAKVVRTPYLTPSGPDALELTATPPLVLPGTPIELTATIDDTRYHNGNGTEPVQAIAAAEYYMGTPPWAPGAPAPAGMLAADGSFDTPIEPAVATIDTSGLSSGQHLVFVRGRDSDGNWGAFSAVFIHVAPDPDDADGDGVSDAADCAANDPDLWTAPSPARELSVSKSPLGNLVWSPPTEPGGVEVSYEVLRSSAGDTFVSVDCFWPFGPSTYASDPTVPAATQTFFYLVRSINGCGSHLGFDSQGQPRSGAPCLP